VNQKDKKIFYSTTYQVLTTLAKMIAPIMPYMAEEIYQNLTKKESVHLTEWPKTNMTSPREAILITDMQKARDMVEKVHAQRKEEEISVKQPLLKAEVISTEKVEIGPEIMEIVKDELNIKEIIFKKGDPDVVLDKTVTPELEEEMKVRELVRLVQSERKNMNLNLNQKVSVSNPWLPKSDKLKSWLINKAQIDKLTLGGFNVKST
jgi:isoleucyl-tRNA synthetase